MEKMTYRLGSYLHFVTTDAMDMKSKESFKDYLDLRGYLYALSNRRFIMDVEVWNEAYVGFWNANRGNIVTI